MKKLKRIFFILIITVVILGGIIILFISPITKYLIEKYDEKYTGRQITLDWAYVNPFTGYIHLKNLKIYEYKSDSIFLSANSLSVDFTVRKFFNHTFEIKSMTLDNPVIKVIRDKKRLNFDDVIEKLSTGDSTPKKPSGTHVNLLNLKIIDAEIHYTDRQIPFDYFIKKANFETSGKHWYEDTMAIKYSFLSGPSKGGISGDFHVNFKTSDYLIVAHISKLDLNPLEQYVKDLTNYGNARANLDADLLAKGNFHSAENINASGIISINDFHLGKNLQDDYMSFEKLKVVVNELSPVNNKYIFDSISLIHPYVKYERYDNTDNLETMFAKKEVVKNQGKNDPVKLNILVTIGRYIKALSNNFFNSNYKVNNLAVIDGDLKFNDYSLSEEFSTGARGLDIVADSINKNHSRVNVYLKSALKPYGNISIHLSIDPNDSSYFNIDYHIQNVPVSIFNPYTVTFTSFPLDRGTIELKGAWNVLGGSIQSRNHLIVVDPRATKRIRGKDRKWIPLPLIFAFIRERGDVIDYEIPVTGNLKDPRFHFHDVVMHLLENIFVKPATTPYRFEVKNTEKVIEKSLQVKWPLMSNTLLPSQEKFISETAGFLAKNKEAFITVEPFDYTAKEKEYISFFEAKKKYYLYANHKTTSSFSAEDSINVNKLSVRDKGFTGYLNQVIKDTLLFTLQDKCLRLCGTKNIDDKLHRLDKNRIETFKDFFKKQHADDQVKIQPLKSTVPFDGFSYFEIGYKGAMPEPLLNAYRKMNELNKEQPRKKYLEEHKKTLP
jgi:uncharacterized protein DUF748